MGAVAGDFGIDLGAPGQRVLQLFQQQHTGALAQHEAAAFGVKGDGCPVGIRGLGQGLHGCEAADCQRGYAGFRAAAEHDVGIAVPDIVEGISHRVGAAGRRPVTGQVHMPLKPWSMAT